MFSGSWRDLPVEFQDDSFGETRTADAGGMTVAFERIKAGIGTAPIFVGLPDDSCQSPHWGFLFKGRFRVLSKDGEHVVEAGQAYYLPPGHNLVIEEGCDLIEFSPAEARRRTLEHAQKRAAEILGA